MIELLGFLPLLLLVCALLLRRYPGERLLAELRRRRRSLRHARERTRRPRIQLRFDSRVPRGGALIGASLAGRAPPASSQPTT
jgi:hypothetical protein